MVGVDERGDEGGERVVISEAQLAHRHRVVLVHHRDHAQLEERLEGRLAFGLGFGFGLGLGLGLPPWKKRLPAGKGCSPGASGLRPASLPAVVLACRLAFSPTVTLTDRSGGP